MKRFFVALLWLGALPVWAEEAPFYQGLHDFGETNMPHLRQLLAASEQRAVHIMQLGDSHTAGAYFSDTLRESLQAVYGQGAPGCFAPLPVHGQRETRVRYLNKGWTLEQAHKLKDEALPFGGYLAQAQEAPASLQVGNVADFTGGHLLFWLRRPHNAAAPIFFSKLHMQRLNEVPDDGRWHVITTEVDRSFFFLAESAGQYDLGLMCWLGGHGLSLSALGINGARLDVWQYWREDWMERDLNAGDAQQGVQLQPDMLILAYGSNEAYDDTRLPEKVGEELRRAVQRLRRALPQAVILIVAAPDVLRDRALGDNAPECAGRRPKNLSTLQDVQRQVAEEQRTLFWDWGFAMGGPDGQGGHHPCWMQAWQKQGLVVEDGVHFQSDGYRRSAEHLAEELLEYWIGE